jgi:hypothetical protein
MAHNIPYDLTGPISITIASESEQGAIAGTDTTYPPFAAFTSSLSGTVVGNAVTFTLTPPAANDCINGGCTSTSLTGTVAANGALSGSYVVYTATGEPEDGTWEADPNVPPEVFGPSGVVQAPPSTACVGRRSFTIHVRQLAGLVYRTVTVELDGHRISVTRGHGISAPIDLRGLPRGTYVVRITVVTTKGTSVTGTRTYHTCRAHPLHPHQPPKL